LESKKILLLSIIVGMIGVVFGYLYINKVKDNYIKGWTPRKVLVASKDIPIRTKITRNMLSVELIPERYLTPKYVLYNTEQDKDKIIGQINLVPILKGQQIATTAIVPPSQEVGLSVNIPPMMRAIILQIDSVDVIDLIKPNDRVDVLTIFNAQHPTKGKVKVVSTVLQNVLVIAVSKDLGAVEEDTALSHKKRKEEKGSKNIDEINVSLAVTPEEAQILSLAKSHGEVTLSLRSYNDNNEKVTLKPLDSSIFLS